MFTLVSSRSQLLHRLFFNKEGATWCRLTTALQKEAVNFKKVDCIKEIETGHYFKQMCALLARSLKIT